MSTRPTNTWPTSSSKCWCARSLRRNWSRSPASRPCGRHDRGSSKTRPKRCIRGFRSSMATAACSAWSRARIWPRPRAMTRAQLPNCSARPPIVIFDDCTGGRSGRSHAQSRRRPLARRSARPAGRPRRHRHARRRAGRLSPAIGRWRARSAKPSPVEQERSSEKIRESELTARRIGARRRYRPDVFFGLPMAAR